MSDFGAAARMDWTLSGTHFEAASFKWGLPLLPHLCAAFSKHPHLPSFEVCLDRLMHQSTGSVDRSWAKVMAQKTDVCLFSRLFNLAAEAPPDGATIERVRDCISEVSPRWVAFAVGFNSRHGHHLNVPLPVPRTKEMVDLIARRARQLKADLGCELALANVSSMFRYSFDSMSETEFWQRLSDASGMRILLDIPAYFVSLAHQELEFDQELAKFPLQQVMSVRVGSLALSNHGVIDAECGRLSVTHWGLLEDVLHALPTGEHKSIFLKWFEPLVSANDLVGEIINGQSILKRLGEL
jgi:hypothetical protein